MRTHLLILALGLSAASATAQAPDAARAIIDRAIVTHGGEAALSKWPVITIRSEGIFHGFDRTPVFFFTSETTSHGSTQFTKKLDGKLHEEPFHVANVLEGSRGWVKIAGNGKEETREFTAKELQSAQESAYLFGLLTLVPLKNPAFTLTVVDGDKTADQPNDGIRVSSPGHRDVTLFFAKKSGLLVKSMTRGRAGTPVEGNIETIYRQHKEIQGMQMPMSMMVSHNGTPLYSHWMRKYRFADKPEPGQFIRP